MSIGIFTQDFYPIRGGQGSHLFNIYQRLKSIGRNDIKIFSPCDNTLEGHIKFGSVRFNNIVLSIILAFQLNNIVKKHSLKLIHFHTGPGGLFLLFLPRSVRIICTCHHTYWQQYNYIKGQRWKKIFYYLERYGYNRSDRIICVSEDTKKILKEKYNISENKLVYIPNGINLEEFQINPSISKEAKSLVFVGRLDERKGIFFLVKSMKKIIAIDHSVKLYIVGTGKLHSKITTYIDTNYLGDNINLLGFMKGNILKERMQRSEIMIVPSVFEGFGISILEGMALNVPVIGTNVDGIKSIIRDGNNGLLVTYNNETSLVSGVFGLLNNKIKQSQLTKNAFSELSDKYDWSIITLSTINEYKKLAS